jgi:hypothetical protein
MALWQIESPATVFHFVLLLQLGGALAGSLAALPLRLVGLRIVEGRPLVPDAPSLGASTAAP